MVVDHPMTTVTVIHTLDGRARLRIPAMKRDHDIANSVQTFLQHQCGIHDVRMNEACASLTVTYDPSVWDSARLSTVLRSYVPRRPRPKPCIDADTVLEESSAAEASGLRFWVSTAGTVLAFVAEPLAAPILPALLLFSAWPVVQKAYDSLVRQRQLNLDVLDATVLTLLSIRGQVQTATVVLWINTLADYLRELTKRGSTEAVTALLTTLQDHAWVVRDGQRLRVSAREGRRGRRGRADGARSVTTCG